MKPVRFLHDFSSCKRTYLTLCIYHESVEPTLMTKVLRVRPDRSQKVGEQRRAGHLASINGWFWGTQGRSDSKDMRAHLYLLFQKFDEKKPALAKLAQMGCCMRIWCFWESASGNGGPILDHETLKRLSDYPVELLYDVWFAEAQNQADQK